MKIAVLSDIHGNIRALESVLQDVHAHKIERLIILGDFVGYYYSPDKVLELLSNWDYEFIRGNHEIMLEKSLRDIDYGQEVEEKYGSGVRVAMEKLTVDQITSLTQAEDVKKLTYAQRSLLLCHGSPWDPDTYIYPDAESEVVNRCLEGPHDFVMAGHTHRPFVRKVGKQVFFNPGSVGQSRIEGGIANWALLDIASDAPQLMATPYDTSQLIEEAKKVDPQVPYLHQVLMRKPT